MKLIKPSYEIIPQQSDLDGIYKIIEQAGRVCYKSEDKITETSAKSFVDRMIKSGHGAMLEHGTIYLHIKPEDSINGFKYRDNKYSKFIEIRESETPSPRLQRYITTNLRVLVENGWLDDLQYLCEPTEFHEKRITVRFVCDRGVSHEYVRHRVFSFAQESTRYCNYSKDKFGNELTFIIPCWMDLIEGSYKYIGYAPVFELNNEEKTFICSQKTYQNTIDYQSPPNEEDLEKIKQENKLFNWLYSIWNSEKSYLEDIKFGATPQQARSVLPNSLKTELVMTGFVSDWKGFFKLRDAGAAHPQARELAKPLHEEFQQLKLI